MDWGASPGPFRLGAISVGDLMKDLFRSIALLSALVLGLATVPVAAYDLQPIVIQLTPAGAGSSQTMTITNTHPVPIAIEVKAYKRNQRPDGSDELTLDEEDLIVFPPQMVIAPGQSQNFKVQWVGDSAPKTELAYRIVTAQLPIKFDVPEVDGRRADLSVNYRYEAALYIMPPGVEPVAELLSAKAVSGQDGTTQIELEIASIGTMRAILDAPSLQVATASGQTLTLTGEDIQPLLGLNILPGNTRIIRIPAPEGIVPGPLTASLSHSYIRLR